MIFLQQLDVLNFLSGNILALVSLIVGRGLWIGLAA